MRDYRTEDSPAFFRTLDVEARSAIRTCEPMRRHTSFRIGGAADLFFQPPTLSALSSTLKAAARAGVPVTFLGGGTNVLISDAGIRGLVVRLGKSFDSRQWQEASADGEGEGGAGATREHVGVRAGAATPLVRLVRETVERGLAGLEFAAGIPGSVGGAVLMNAGAFGGEIGDAIVCIEAVTEDGEILRLQGEDLKFSYRKLALDRPIMVTSVSFRLLRSSVGRLKSVVEAVQKKRRKHQPLGYPNAGSVFKNPPNDYAGKLVERTGLRGTTVGGAQISTDHANFIVNLGTASASDVRVLMRRMQEEVWRKSGIWLEPEVRLVGEWNVAEAAL